jgi:hypothetical protein
MSSFGSDRNHPGDLELNGGGMEIDFQSGPPLGENSAPKSKPESDSITNRSTFTASAIMLALVILSLFGFVVFHNTTHKTNDTPESTDVIDNPELDNEQNL